MMLRLRRLVRYILMAAIVVLAASFVLAYLVIRPTCQCKSITSDPIHAGDNLRTIRSGGVLRCYVLHVPAAYRSNRPAAVVISLHGLAISPGIQEYVSGWSKLAERENFIVVYPQGTLTPLRWNAAPVYNTAVDDIGFLRDLIADLQSVAAFDPARVYVNGMSNGGALANRVACSLADHVVAVGSVSGLYPELPEGCSPSRPVSIISFHGTADPLAKFGGGIFAPGFPLGKLLGLATIRTPYPAVGEWIRGWAERNGCRGKVGAMSLNAEVEVFRYEACQQNVEVVSYVIKGGGHAWPGGPATGIGKTTTAIEATKVMWEFFKAHPRSK
jgi:polyhydroxybutyrate depolymerase